MSNRWDKPVVYWKQEMRSITPKDVCTFLNNLSYIDYDAFKKMISHNVVSKSWEGVGCISYKQHPSDEGTIYVLNLIESMFGRRIFKSIDWQKDRAMFTPVDD